MHTEPSNSPDVTNTTPTNPINPPTRKQHVLGVTLLLTVACIWVISGELIQTILGEANKPFLLTYFSISLFSICLIGFSTPSWRAAFDPSFHYKPLTDTPANNHSSSQQPSPRTTPPGIRAVRLAAVLAPLFLLSNWTFNTGLEKTSVASSSTIGTLTTLFALIFGALLGVEEFSLAKLLAIALVMTGVALITVNDKRQSGDSHLNGDLISVASAAIYAIYTVILTKYSGPDGQISMLMMLGFMGFFTAISAWPAFFLLDFWNVESFEVPSFETFTMLTVNGLVGTVLSDFLWAKGVVLTTPLIGTLALSLSVPLSMLADLVLGRANFNWVFLLGAGLVFTGFILVNAKVAVARKDHATEQCVEADTLHDEAEHGLPVQLQETSVR